MGPSGLVSGSRERVDGEGPVGQGLELLDGGLKVLRGGIGGHIDGTQPPGVGHGGSQAGLDSHCMAPWMMGYWMPKSSVIRVFMEVPPVPGVECLHGNNLPGRSQAKEPAP